jgi:hypothetical protein
MVWVAPEVVPLTELALTVKAVGLVQSLVCAIIDLLRNKLKSEIENSVTENLEIFISLNNC